MVCGHGGYYRRSHFIRFWWIFWVPNLWPYPTTWEDSWAKPPAKRYFASNSKDDPIKLATFVQTPFLEKLLWKIPPAPSKHMKGPACFSGGKMAKLCPKYSWCCWGSEGGHFGGDSVSVFGLEPAATGWDHPTTLNFTMVSIWRFLQMGDHKNHGCFNTKML